MRFIKLSLFDAYYRFLYEEVSGSSSAVQPAEKTVCKASLYFWVYSFLLSSKDPQIEYGVFRLSEGFLFEELGDAIHLQRFPRVINVLEIR